MGLLSIVLREQIVKTFHFAHINQWAVDFSFYLSNIWLGFWDFLNHCNSQKPWMELELWSSAQKGLENVSQKSIRQSQHRDLAAQKGVFPIWSSLWWLPPFVSKFWHLTITCINFLLCKIAWPRSHSCCYSCSWHVDLPLISLVILLLQIKPH